MAVSSFSSLLLLFLLSLLSTAFTSMHGFIQCDPLIQQVVSSGSRDDHDLLTSAERQFSAFKKEYGKTYPTQEEDDFRFGVFISNLRQARLNQILDPTAVHGVTKFSDLTPSEFRRQYLGSGHHIQLPKDISLAPELPTNNLPPEKNWKTDGAVTPVKNQSNCDSCWAFSSIAVLEAAHFLANGKLVNLSEQELIDCTMDMCTNKTDNRNVCNYGCGGGHRLLAYRYMKNSGVVTGETYNFTGKNGTCERENKPSAAYIRNFSYIKPDEKQYAAYLVEHGPIAVSIDMGNFQTYQNGVSCPAIDCESYNGNHAVALVGYKKTSTDSENHQKQEFWWIAKNSYGENWGESGYFRFCEGLLTKCAKNKDPFAAYIVAGNETAGSY